MSIRRFRALGAVVAVIAGCLTFVVATPAPASALSTVTAVSGGGRTVCVILSGGNAYCWGDNTYGQFGDGTTNSSATPVLVSGGLTWASISTEYDTHGDNVATTCGVTTGGDGYCWGNNAQGEVGDGTTTPRTSPTLIPGGLKWLSIHVGFADVCGVTVGHVGYCWGMNTAGEVGNNSNVEVNSPTAVSGGLSWSVIDEDGYESCGVTTTNAGYCWGYNVDGQNGDGGSSDNWTPTLISGGHSWSTIGTGTRHACGITTAGDAYCWGDNLEGNLGEGDTTQHSTPQLVSGGLKWSTIGAGDFNTCGVTTSGVGYCWGATFAGENGDGNQGGGAHDSVPTAVSGALKFSTIDVGDDYVTDDTNCGITGGGVLYCWGLNDESQVGDNTTGNRDVPTEATVLVEVTANSTVSVMIKPTFSFSVGNESSACNGESNFVSGAGTATTVALGSLAAGANVSGGQSLTVAGNSGGGFAVYVAGTQPSQNLRSASTGHNFTDVSGTYATPAALSSGTEQFGYTYHDSTASSSVANPAAANFIALTNANEAVMGSNSSPTGSGCISYDASASASTPASSYSATIIYTAVPTF